MKITIQESDTSKTMRFVGEDFRVVFEAVRPNVHANPREARSIELALNQIKLAVDQELKRVISYETE